MINVWILIVLVGVSDGGHASRVAEFRSFAECQTAAKLIQNYRYNLKSWVVPKTFCIHGIKRN